MLTIPQGHKYATLALQVRRLNRRFSNPHQLSTSLFAASEPPLAIPDHWQIWLGTLRVEELQRANLFLLAHAPSQHPDSLDDENRQLSDIIHKLYFGMLIAVRYISHAEGFRMTGVHHGSEVDVREVTNYEEVLAPAGCRGEPLEDAVLDAARLVAEGITAVEVAGAHDRTWRIIRAFYRALRSNEFGSRIHQYVRCIEGFILPDIGRTRRQFIHRSALFVGDGHDDLLGKLFDVRSAVEHLHGTYAIVTAPDRRAADLELAELAFKAEMIARHCLQRLFLTPALWPHFRDDASLAAFWRLPDADRIAIWGAPTETRVAFAFFDHRTAAEELG
jgi:hypothetical protein